MLVCVGWIVSVLVSLPLGVIACSVIFDCHIFRSYGPAHRILLLIVCVHSDVSSVARGLMFGSDLHLLQYPVYVRSKGSGQTVHICILI